MIRDCTAIILAGGDSRRMGRDKVSLPLGGQTLLQRVSASMQQVFPQTIVSVRERRPELDAMQVCDEQPDSGPLAGLAACMGCVTTPWVFAVACDMPFIEPAVVELLGRFRSGHQAVVPVAQGHPQPLAAFYASRCRTAMQIALLTPNRSLRGLLAQLDVRYVEEVEMREVDPQLRSFFDLDTPQDMATAMQGVK